MGLDVLKWLRERPQFDSIVVIVLTSSRNRADIDTAYRLHANAYLVKPTGMDSLVSIAKSIKEFWLVQNQSPQIQKSELASSQLGRS
jgi:DNA-binding NarL/FixJ family response regulator